MAHDSPREVLGSPIQSPMETNGSPTGVLETFPWVASRINGSPREAHGSHKRAQRSPNVPHESTRCVLESLTWLGPLG